MNKTLFILAMVATLGGCAAAPSQGGGDTRDPLEGFNRGVYKFNDSVDRAVLKPVAQGYTDVVPEPVRSCVSNVFSNLSDIWSAANSFLQNRAPDGINTTFRVLFNTTMGVFGCFDVASANGAPRVRADFGQTLGVWGVGQGPYLVLPLLGPSTIRDTGGVAVNFVANPAGISNAVSNVPVRNSLYGLKAVSTRADLLTVGNLLNDVALDSYAFTRDAYLQRRESLVRGARLDGDEEDSLPDYSLPDDDAPEDAGQPGNPPSGAGAR